MGRDVRNSTQSFARWPTRWWTHRLLACSAGAQDGFATNDPRAHPDGVLFLGGVAHLGDFAKDQRHAASHGGGMAGSDGSPPMDCWVWSCHANPDSGSGTFWHAGLTAGGSACVARRAARIVVRAPLGALFNVFLNSREQICLLFNQSGSEPGYQMKHFLPSPPAYVRFEERPQRRLTSVSFEGGDFSLQIIPDLDDRGCWRQGDWLAIGHGKVCGTVVELLGLVRDDFACELVGIPIVPSRPVDCQRGEH